MEDFVLLPKKQVALPEVKLVTLGEFRKAHREAIQSFSSGPVGLDFESNTYDYCSKDFYIRTVGLANKDYCYSIDLLDASEEDLNNFKSWVAGLDYVAYNAMMEEGSIQRWAGKRGSIVADCYILYADLATEERRPLGLGEAMHNLLGQEKEKDLVKEYMKANSYTWEDVKKFDFALLGRYNAIDAWGAFELFCYFSEVINSYKDTWGAYYWDYHNQDCLNSVTLQVESRLKGIHVEVDEMENSYKDLSAKRDDSLGYFLGDDRVAPHIEAYNKGVCEEILSKKPEKYTSKGKLAARYVKWQDKLAEAQNTQHFNLNSTKQLRWLFFDKMGLNPVEYTDTGEPSTAAACLKKMGPQAKALLEYRNYVTQLKFLTQLREGQSDGTISPHVKLWATLTTRAGGGILN